MVTCLKCEKYSKGNRKAAALELLDANKVLPEYK